MTNETMKDGKRAAFEAWALNEAISIVRSAHNSDEYAYPAARASWKAWQARAAASQAALSDAEDAERYRWLKMRSSIPDQQRIMLSTPWGQWDAAIDAARKAEIERKEGIDKPVEM